MFKKAVLLLISHALVLAIGFALGVYFLPILTAPDAPSAAQLATAFDDATFRADIRPDLAGSDALHQGQGQLLVKADAIAMIGKLSPGPDFQLYLSPQWVETAEDFHRLKAQMVKVGPVRTFENFQVAVPDSIDVTDYTTAVVWCEAFGAFITAGQYQGLSGV